MTSAREINKKLDHLSKAIADLNEIKNKYSSDTKFTLKNSKTGEVVDKEIVFDTANKTISGIKDDLNKLTHNGEHIKDVFNNPYYINSKHN